MEVVPEQGVHDISLSDQLCPSLTYDLSWTRSSQTRMRRSCVISRSLVSWRQPDYELTHGGARIWHSNHAHAVLYFRLAYGPGLQHSIYAVFHYSVARNLFTGTHFDGGFPWDYMYKNSATIAA